MAELVALLSWRAESAPETREKLLKELRRDNALVSPISAGGRNAGDVLVRTTMASNPPHDFGLGALYDETVASADGAVFDTITGSGDPVASPVHRTALFCADRNPDPERLARFERETVAIPRLLPVIRGWRLGRVLQGWGRFRWTYVWEQGFDRAEHLTHDYMMAPVHWGHVDRWFDPEHPDFLIDPGLCHAFCDNPVGAVRTP